MSDNILFFDAPFDVVECIFAHLPVRILLRYRCVSKFYRDLIDSRYFANLHCGHSMRSRSNRNILCWSFGVLSVGEDAGMHTVGVDTLSHSVVKCPKGWDYFSQYVGSCNGLVLLYDGYKELTIWNPAIRTYIDVPVPHVSILDQGSIGNYKYNFGFGYDHCNDDYKVIISVQLVLTAILNGEDIVREVHVFSLKSNIWRKIGDFPYYVRETGCHGTYVDGALYWVCIEQTADSGFCNLIVAFDLETEEYRVVQTPVYEGISSGAEIKIGSLEGYLWAHCYFDGQPNLGHVDDSIGIADLWLFQQRQEDQGTWTKLISFNDPDNYRKPLAYSKRGKHLLLDDRMNFSWYDLIKGEEGRKINIRGLPAYYGSDICVQTLIHLDIENQQTREKKVVEEDIETSNEDSIFSVMANYVAELVREMFEL